MEPADSTRTSLCGKMMKYAKEEGEQEAESPLCNGIAHSLNNQHEMGMENVETQKRNLYHKMIKRAQDWKKARKQADKPQDRELLLGFGCTFEQSNQFQTKIEYFENALKSAKARKDERHETEALIGLGEAYGENNQIQMAIQCFQDALEIAREQGDKQYENVTLVGLGDTHTSNGQFRIAIEYYERALEIEKERGDSTQANLLKKAIEELVKISESSGLWKWEENSKVHREKFIKLREYGKTHAEDIKDVNGVRVCCSNEFLIGKGSDGTRVYVGLGKDGYERAVKRLPRDACVGLAKQEKRVLNELNTTKSNFVVKYRSLDEESDKDYLFLILDLCEETLENFVADNSLEDLVTIAPDIIRQVLKGLSDLHRHPKPILHRDLKPSNILRNVYGIWLLTDFGISRILQADVSTLHSNQRGTEDWTAVESSYPSNHYGKVRYKKKSDIQVAGMVAFYILTKGQHPFGERPDRFRNLLDGKAVFLNMLEDPAAKDLISWMLCYDPENRPSAEEALKHPYLQPVEQQFEMLCRMGNQPEIKTGDVKSDVVRTLNSDPKDWRSLMNPDVLKYLSTDPLNGYTFRYTSSWTDCLRLIRNVKECWHDRPRPRPELFYLVGDPPKFFLNLFPNLPVKVHRIVKSCGWKDRPNLQQYFK